VRSPLSRHASSPALRFLREALADPLAPAAASRWRERLAAGGVVAEIAREEAFRRALPLCARWVEDAGVADDLPAAERAVLLAARLAARARAIAVAETLGPLGAACRAEGVEPVLLKGVALHGDLYPDPALRPVSDVDLWVPPGGLPAVRRALAAAGLAPDAITAARLAACEASSGRESFLSDFVFRLGSGRGVPVEVKLDPVQLGVPVATARRFEADARPSAAYPGFRALAGPAMLCQQALHLARHDGSDLVWFAELAWVARRAAERGTLGPSGRARFAALVEGEGLLGVVREVLRETERLFPGSVLAALPSGPAGPTPRRIREKAIRPGPPDERAATLSLQAFHAVAAKRPWPALSALWRRAFPHPDYVAARLALAPGAHVGLRHRLQRFAYLIAPRRPR
jgi:hypothetical protein